MKLTENEISALRRVVAHYVEAEARNFGNMPPQDETPHIYMDLNLLELALVRERQPRVDGLGIYDVARMLGLK